MIKKCSPGKYRCFSKLWQQQGSYIFEKLISLSFPWDFQGIVTFFPWEKWEKSSLEYIFVDDYVTYFTFSLGFPGFSTKIKISLRFWQFFKFPEFSRFSMFFRFVATLNKKVPTLQICGCTYSRSFRPEAPNARVSMWPIGPLAN